jgi:hypothetical protein
LSRFEVKLLVDKEHQQGQKKLNYLHKNPVVAGIVENDEEYLNSSCRDYYSDKNIGNGCKK